MARNATPLKDFIYGNLPYLLLAPLALALLLAEQEIGFGFSRGSAINPSSGLVLGLTEQRLVAALVFLAVVTELTATLLLVIRQMWLNRRG